MASLKAQCPPPRPQLGSSCLRLSPPLLTAPCSQGFLLETGKHFIPIICRAPHADDSNTTWKRPFAP